jgi:hypothetical protein
MATTLPPARERHLGGDPVFGRPISGDQLCTKNFPTHWGGVLMNPPLRINAQLLLQPAYAAISAK